MSWSSPFPNLEHLEVCNPHCKEVLDYKRSPFFRSILRLDSKLWKCSNDLKIAPKFWKQNSVSFAFRYANLSVSGSFLGSVLLLRMYLPVQSVRWLHNQTDWKLDPVQVTTSHWPARKLHKQSGRHCLSLTKYVPLMLMSSLTTALLKQPFAALESGCFPVLPYAKQICRTNDLQVYKRTA